MTANSAVFARQYAIGLGCVVQVNQHDSGQTWVIENPESRIVWRGSFDWGDEERFFARLNKFLHTLPWPREEDPREGAEL